MEDKLQWGRAIQGELFERWPKDEKGEPETPALLCNCKNVDLDAALRINMLEAFGIPCLPMYPGDGAFGRVVVGMSGQGTDIYVPQSLLDDALQLLDTPEEPEDELI